MHERRHDLGRPAQERLVRKEDPPAEATGGMKEERPRPAGGIQHAQVQRVRSLFRVVQHPIRLQYRGVAPIVVQDMSDDDLREIVGRIELAEDLPVFGVDQPMVGVLQHVLRRSAPVVTADPIGHLRECFAPRGRLGEPTLKASSCAIHERVGGSGGIVQTTDQDTSRRDEQAVFGEGARLGERRFSWRCNPGTLKQTRPQTQPGSIDGFILQVSLKVGDARQQGIEKNFGQVLGRRLRKPAGLDPDDVGQEIVELLRRLGHRTALHGLDGPQGPPPPRPLPAPPEPPVRQEAPPIRIACPGTVRRHGAQVALHLVSLRFVALRAPPARVSTTRTLRLNEDPGGPRHHVHGAVARRHLKAPDAEARSNERRLEGTPDVVLAPGSS